MKRIRSKDTSIELILRKELWKRGYRYRKNPKNIYGKPDIAFPGKKVAIFADSEFWHGKYLKEGKYIPKTNREFWIKKLERNIERDKEVTRTLEKTGWTVLRFWEADIRKNLDTVLNKIENTLK